MENQSKINCPECGTVIDVNHVLANSLEKKLKDELQHEHQEQLDDLLKEMNSLKKVNDLSKLEIEKARKEAYVQAKESLEKSVRDELQEETKLLQEELQKKSEQVKEFHKLKASLAKSEREMSELKDRLEAENEAKLSEGITKARIDAKKEAVAAHELKLKERDELVENLKLQINDLKQRAEQGSMQSQGEILELEVERLLSRNFPLDDIFEIKKGINGADCLHIIKTLSGKEAGVIAFESKRTKSFNEQWIDKLKGDMRLHKADEGVIVTEVMPKDMPSFGKRNGIWICKFDEVEALAQVLRHTLLRVNEIKISNVGKGEKMQVLYDFLISTEFKQQMEAIVNGYVNMRNQIDSEKRSMKRQWKEREKQLDLVIDGATEMYGSIKGIAGSAIQEIKALEMGSQKLIEN